jgi:hypothetical protein
MVQAQLKHRNIGLRIQVPQHAPRPMVQSPLLIQLQVLFDRQPLGYGWGSWRRVLDLVQRARKSVKIVNRFWPVHPQHLTAARADTTQMALGTGSRRPNSRKHRVKAFCSIAFIGDPCPTNKTGIGIEFPNPTPILTPPVHRLGNALHTRYESRELGARNL